MENKVYEMVTDRILAEMEKGIIPWQMPWFGASDGAINYVTRKPYSLLNQMLLGRDGEWLTYKQIEQLGGKIKKGEKAHFVVFWKWIELDKDGKIVTDKNTEVEDRIPYLRYYNVWHIEQCEGIKTKIEKVEGLTEHEPDAKAEQIINAYVEREGVKFCNKSMSHEAFYRPATDEVVVPMLSQYEQVEEYYSTAFHELVHSTGATKRLNRMKADKVAAHGSSDYGKEELVAECGSAMLCNHVGFNCEKAFRNSVAYLQGWMKAIRADKKMLVFAAGQAEKASNYILGVQD